MSIKKIALKCWELLERYLLYKYRAKDIINRLGLVLVGWGGLLLTSSTPIVIQFVDRLLQFISDNETTITRTTSIFEWFSFSFGVVLIVLGIILIILQKSGQLEKLFKSRKLIISHWSLGNPTFPINELKREYRLINIPLNLTTYLKNRHKTSSVKKAIKRQDKICSKILAIDAKFEDCSYMSITSLPFVSRLAYMLGNEQRYRLYEKKKTDLNLGFVELTNEPGFPPLNIIDVNIVEHKDLVVTISITRQIDYAHIPASLDTSSYCHFQFEDLQSQRTCDDAIVSYVQILEYREKIREMITRSKCNIVHIFYSGPTSFMFDLASSFTENYDPDFVVYEYKHPRYLWGINCKERNYRKALVDL